MIARMFLVAGVASYVLFLMTTLYAVAFFGNFLVPNPIDSFGAVPVSEALLINFGLLTLFSLQHSGMASGAFKRWQARFIPACLERSTFVFVSSVTLIALMVLWQPIGSIVWSVLPATGRTIVNAIYFAGWALIVWSTFLIDHLAYFGVRQAYNGYRGRTCEPSKFRTPGAYRVIRHPIHTGWLIVLWATPTMTITRLVLAIGLTLYVVLGTRLEERGLMRTFEAYAQYIRKVPMLVPSLRRHLAASDEN